MPPETDQPVAQGTEHVSKFGHNRDVGVQASSGGAMRMVRHQPHELE